MAYKALYRTYRPSSFNEVAGQNHIVQTLKHAVEQDKIAHAYLFCGPRGTGKTSIAKIFAKMINCTDSIKPCMKCDNCLAFQIGNHPDIIEIDAASNNGVEEVRSLIEKVKYAPLKGKYKIYIIDEVHMMSTGAFNALLKTIEEPPEHVIFILATTEPHKVLPTIISRCQRFDFTKVSKQEIVNRIHTILHEEKIVCEEEVIRIIAQLADGGLRDALSILDQCIAYAQNNIEVHHINEIYGITTVDEKLSIFKNVFKRDINSLMEVITDFIEKGVDIKRLTVDLIEILKESVIFEHTKDSTLLKDLESDEALLLIASLTLEQRFDMIHLLMETYDKYKSAASVSSYFEVCILQMLDSKDDTLKEIKNVNKPILNESVQKKDVSRETLLETSILEEPVDVSYEEDISYLEEPIPIDVEVEKVETKSNPKTELKSIKTSHSLISEDVILSLLAGATKPEKAIDMESYKQISEFLLDIKWVKPATLLKSSCIVASGENYLVVSVDNQALANEINEIDKKNEFNEFIQKLLNKNKKIYAITKEYQKYITQVFMERMKSGTLPDPVYIETVEFKKTEVKEKTQEEMVMDLFGKENIKILED